ncbi:hypothetical protein ACVWZR_007617 [Bradyrhizobium sp. i1.3.1]
MAEIEKTDARPLDGRWSVAAALGLVAVAFLWDRVVPPRSGPPPWERRSLP